MLSLLVSCEHGGYDCNENSSFRMDSHFLIFAGEGRPVEFFSRSCALDCFFCLPMVLCLFFSRRCFAILV